MQHSQVVKLSYRFESETLRSIWNDFPIQTGIFFGLGSNFPLIFGGGISHSFELYLVMRYPRLDSIGKLFLPE